MPLAIVDALSATLTDSPAVPAKARRAFCPAAAVVTVTGAPATMLPVTSGGTSASLSVAEPVVVPDGSTRTV